eukprot:15462622-Alexandrium_andersonii.AAC.1
MRVLAKVSFTYHANASTHSLPAHVSALCKRGRLRAASAQACAAACARAAPFRPVPSHPVRAVLCSVLSAVMPC